MLGGMSEVTHILNALAQGDPRRPTSSCPWCTPSCGGWLPGNWPRSGRARGPGDFRLQQKAGPAMCVVVGVPLLKLLEGHSPADGFFE
jgi:hypothetical protein